MQEIIEKSHNQFHRGLLIKIRENTINMALNKVKSCAEGKKLGEGNICGKIRQ